MWWGMFILMWGIIIQIFGTAVAFALMVTAPCFEQLPGFLTLIGANGMGLVLIHLSKYAKN